MIVDKKFSINEYRVTWKVSAEHSGLRLDQYIMQFFNSFSREEIKRRIASKEIFIDGRPLSIKPSTKVYEDNIIQMIMRKGSAEDEFWHGKKLELTEIPKTIFEDDDLLVISKPAFMTTHPTGRHIYYCATVYFEDIYKKTIHSVHRLDRETSGILLLAKNPQTAQKLTPLFEEGTVRKCYFFISKSNHTPESSFEAKERMDSTEEGRKRVLIQYFPESSTDGKHAHTIFKILYSTNGYHIGLAFPKTGRQHQIRVHAFAHNIPLLGDKLYLGSYEMFQRFKDNYATDEDHEFMEIPRQALHAVAINFSYKNQIRTFIDHLPSDLVEWMNDKLDISISDIESKISQEINTYFARHEHSN